MLDNISNKNKKRIAISIIAILVAYIIFRTTRKIIVRRKLKKEIIDLNIDIFSLFNPNNWENMEPSISDPLARNLATKINNSRGIVYDDRATIISIISGLKNKGDVSLLANQYYSLFERDLAQDIEDIFKNNSADRSLLYLSLSRLK